MTPDPYRNAYETAFAELTHITAQFERLRTRKSHVENLIAVLQPMFGDYEVTAPEPQANVEAVAEQFAVEASAQESEPAGYSFLEVPSPLPESNGDPFERRARSSFRFRGLATQRY